MALVGQPQVEPGFAYRFHRRVLFLHIAMLLLGMLAWPCVLVLTDIFKNNLSLYITVGIAWFLLQVILIHAGQFLRAAASPHLVLPVTRAYLRRCYLVYASVAVMYALLMTGLSTLAWVALSGALNTDSNGDGTWLLVPGLMCAAAAFVTVVDVYVAAELVPAKRAGVEEGGAATAATGEAASSAAANPEHEMRSVDIADDRQFSTVGSGALAGEDTSRPPPMVPSMLAGDGHATPAHPPKVEGGA